MADAAASVGVTPERARLARRGLALYLGLVLVLSGILEGAILSTGSLALVPILMWTPAFASIVARLALREGFSDVSFRIGGRRGWTWILLSPLLPIVVGIVAYGIAWASGLATFVPPEGAPGESPLVAFASTLLLVATLGTIQACLFAAGEEIGWRGYMLTRLIEAGVPRPILVSGLIWGGWHAPLIVGGLYAAGPSPLVSAVLFMVVVVSISYVFARARLETGSVWPAIVLHGAWNAIIQGAFDPATGGAGALWWTGESGLLVVLTVVVVAWIVSRGRWRMVITLPRAATASPAGSRA